VATSSTVATVRTQLVTLISAALPGIAVTRTRPRLAELEREHIWLEPRATGRHEIAAIKAGRKPRQESYTLTAVVSVLDQDESDGPEVAEARALVLLSEIEDVLADDPRLGLAGAIDWATASEFESQVFLSAEPEGWLAEAKLGIDVVARLT